MDQDTIFALSSGSPPAAIAVLRISGPDAGSALSRLAGPLPQPRTAVLREIRDDAGELLDHALILWFPGPSTVTGEDLAELHLHGGRAIVSGVEAALVALGLRFAVAGEFTRRALFHGRIDLAQAEGLADLLVAETADQRRTALAATEGHVSRAIGGWYHRLIAAAALIEADLDHADEDDVARTRDDPLAAVAAVMAEMEEVLKRPTVERARDGLSVVLAGPPNAGKSSLLNVLVEHDAAIVTPVAGTTRDIISVPVVRHGRVMRLIDTAGLTDTANVVEHLGVQRARAAHAQADILLWLGDTAPSDDRAIWLATRCDLPGRGSRTGAALAVSVHQSATIAALWSLIECRARDILPAAAPFRLVERQRAILAAAHAPLGVALGATDALLQAEALRVSIGRLDELLGRHAGEEILTALFARFCIGK